jgi:rhodanese-related sulfurtransferase
VRETDGVELAVRSVYRHLPVRAMCYANDADHLATVYCDTCGQRLCPACGRRLHSGHVIHPYGYVDWSLRPERGLTAEMGELIGDTARALKAGLHDGLEITLLDAREEQTFGERHILMAACMPLGRIEVMADDMVPRRQTRVVWCDDGGSLCERAAQRMADLGYSDVSVLDGGIAAWESAGFRIYSGVHVPSKAFAEVVEHNLGTPWITATELKALIDAGRDIAVFDSRSFAEYHSNSIPSAVSVPGAELVYRFKDLVPSPSTMVIVNCGGRTRSIIGAQSLINAGVPNKVVSLKDGTMAWHLAGFQVAQGAGRRPPEVSAASAEVGESRIPLHVGQQVLVRDLLAGALIQSANNAATALAAAASGGDVPRFVQWMNARAKKLGLRDTHFVRPDGLDIAGHVIQGRAAMIEYLRTGYPAGSSTHFFSVPNIMVSGDEARGVADFLVATNDGKIASVGRVHDEWVRCPDRWRLRLRRISIKG